MNLSKTLRIIDWIVRIVVAVVLLQTLFFKFTAAKESVYIFSTLGAEPWGRVGSGVVELVAAILLLIPRTAVYGAILALGTISGAIFAHLTKLGITIPAVDDHGRAALNFQLTVLIASLVGVAAAIFFLAFFCLGVLFIPVIFAISIAGIVFSIIAAVKASEGTLYQYPWTLTML